MDRIKAALSGRKTYLVSFGLIAAGLASLFGWVQIDAADLEALVVILSGLGAAAMRAGLAKVGEVASGSESAAPEPKGSDG